MWSASKKNLKKKKENTCAMVCKVDFKVNKIGGQHCMLGS